MIKISLCAKKYFQTREACLEAGGVHFGLFYEIRLDAHQGEN